MRKFASRQSFADAVVEAWKASGFSIEHVVISLEAHANDAGCDNNQVNRYHYHMALKLKRRGRWLQVRNYLDEK